MWICISAIAPGHFTFIVLTTNSSIPKYSGVKRGPICPTAKARTKLSHETGQRSQVQSTIEQNGHKGKESQWCKSQLTRNNVVGTKESCE